MLFSLLQHVRYHTQTVLCAEHSSIYVVSFHSSSFTPKINLKDNFLTGSTEESNSNCLTHYFLAYKVEFLVTSSVIPSINSVEVPYFNAVFIQVPVIRFTIRMPVTECDRFIVTHPVEVWLITQHRAASPEVFLSSYQYNSISTIFRILFAYLHEMNFNTITINVIDIVWMLKEISVISLCTHPLLSIAFLVDHFLLLLWWTPIYSPMYGNNQELYAMLPESIFLLR